MNNLPEVTAEEFAVLSKMLSVGSVTVGAMRRRTFTGWVNSDLAEKGLDARNLALLQGMAARKLVFRFEYNGAHWSLTNIGCDCVRAGPPRSEPTGALAAAVADEDDEPKEAKA